LKYEILIGLREVLERLRDGGHISIDECDGGGTDEKLIEAFDTCFTSCEASKRVFVDAVLGSVLAQSETKCGEVCDGKTAVFSDDYSGCSLNLAANFCDDGFLFGTDS
jgi:hypothetical protein